METRRSALTVLNRAVNENTEYLDRYGRPSSVRDKLNDFTDETLALLSEAVQDPYAGDLVTYRMIKFLCTYQQRGVEAVIRNIAIFAKEEMRYIEMFGLKWDERWQAFAFMESRIRIKVTGNGVFATETADDRAAMVASFHAYVALAMNYVDDKFPGWGKYSAYSFRHAMNSFKGNAEQVTPVVDFFVAHQDDASRLGTFVSTRGVVDTAILQNFLEHESAFSSGVL